MLAKCSAGCPSCSQKKPDTHERDSTDTQGGDSLRESVGRRVQELDFSEIAMEQSVCSGHLNNRINQGKCALNEYMCVKPHKESGKYDNSTM